MSKAKVKIKSIGKLPDQCNQNPEISDVIMAISEIAQVFTKYGKKPEQTNDYIVSFCLEYIYRGFFTCSVDFLQTYPSFTKEQKKEIRRLVSALRTTGTKLGQCYKNLS